MQPPKETERGGLGIKVRVVRCKREKAIQKREVLAPYHEGKGESGRKGHPKTHGKAAVPEAGLEPARPLLAKGF